ncbi:hypothetical protein [Aliarcobacter butzleri]|uniref:hypothetical protein n=1 Tax=Aliarcobacter butzleri TaxID=28197 RepID=UPI00126A286C|nr:hypothetical protein [Aliarcobacter butzleri]
MKNLLGKKIGDFLITQFLPLSFDDLGSPNGGTVKLVNQITMETILVQNNKMLRESNRYWFTKSFKGVTIKEKSLNKLFDIIKSAKYEIV